MRKRLMAVVAAALLPALGMLVFNEITLRQQRSAELNEEAAQAARHVTSEVDRIIDGTRSLLIAISSIPAVIDKEPAGCAQALKRASGRLQSVRTILVIDTEGKLVCDSIGTPPGTDFSDRDYFRQALDASDVVVGTYLTSRLSGTAVLPVAMPVRNGAAVSAVVATGIRLDWLQDRIRERGVVEGGAVTIADRNGTIIARDPLPERFVGTAIPETYRYLVNAKTPGTIRLVSQDGTERVLGYHPATIGTPLYISAGISTEEAFGSINRATAIGVAFIVAGSLIALFSAISIGNHFILTPIRHIVQVIDEWRGGKTHVRVGMHGQNGELGIVAAALDELLDDLEEEQRRSAVAEQRRSLLARELSHRVKNTLAIIQAIARQTFRSSDKEEYRTFSNRILALAGAYDTLLADDQASDDIVGVVNRALKPHRNAETAVQVEGPPVELSPKCVVAMSLVIHELATNAVKYGALSLSSGQVQISWSIIGDSVIFVWEERGGPLVAKPEREGFGSKLVRSAFPASCEAVTAFDFAPEGLIFTLQFSRQAAGEAEPLPESRMV